jgi:hypothetical protein
MRPIVAIIVAAVVASTPGIVISRRMSSEASTCSAIDHRELLAEEVDLAQAAIERVTLVGGQHERRHELAAGPAEQVADLGARDQVADQDGGHFGVSSTLSG